MRVSNISVRLPAPQTTTPPRSSTCTGPAPRCPRPGHLRDAGPAPGPRKAPGQTRPGVPPHWGRPPPAPSPRTDLCHGGGRAAAGDPPRFPAAAGAAPAGRAARRERPGFRSGAHPPGGGGEGARGLPAPEHGGDGDRRRRGRRGRSDATRQRRGAGQVRRGAAAAAGPGRAGPGVPSGVKRRGCRCCRPRAPPRARRAPWRGGSARRHRAAASRRGGGARPGAAGARARREGPRVGVPPGALRGLRVPGRRGSCRSRTGEPEKPGLQPFRRCGIGAVRGQEGKVRRGTAIANARCNNSPAPAGPRAQPALPWLASHGALRAFKTT